MRIDQPAEGDSTPASRTESPAADSAPRAAPDLLDRVAHNVSYRATVGAAYHHQPADAVESGSRRFDADSDSWHSGGDRSLVSAESVERDAYLVHYRTLVETEYQDASEPTDSGLPELRQSSAVERRFLHADADPLRVLGAALETHPDEFQAVMARLDSAGVEVDLRPGSMSYSPGADGKPGRLILDPEASYGAVLHEMSHFSDDESAGYPGMRHWLEDPTVTAGGESRAYQAEIDYANYIGEAGLAKQLEELKSQRINELLSGNDE